MTPGAGPEETLAIGVAIERFLAEARGSAQRHAVPGKWQRAGLLEGVGLDPRAPHPWSERYTISRAL